MTNLRTALSFSLLAMLGCEARGNSIQTVPDDPPVEAGTVDVVASDLVVSGDRVAPGDAQGSDGGVPLDQPAPVDAGCVRTADENTPAACMNGVDDDCDGFIDCMDFSCSRNNPAVTFCPQDAGAPADIACTLAGPENTDTACRDGRDNDCDGFTDCNDFDCSRSAIVTVCPRDGGAGDTGCVPSPESTAAACADGRDNDCDGYTDCNDFDCPSTTCPRDAGARDVVCVGTPTAESNNAQCSDGIDNDCDGFTDCIDRGCTSTCLVTVCGPRDAGACVCRGEESSNAACGNGFDDDCDGFIDCRDFDCTMNNPAVTVCRDGGA